MASASRLFTTLSWWFIDPGRPAALRDGLARVDRGRRDRTCIGDAGRAPAALPCARAGEQRRKLAPFMKVQPTHRVWDRETCPYRGGGVPERAGPKTSARGAGHARDTESSVLDAHRGRSGRNQWAAGRAGRNGPFF